MKFRSSILSLAAVSALTATAFMVTGCGSSSSGDGGDNQDTSQNLTGYAAKGLWGGIPYEIQRHKDNSTHTGFTTGEDGEFEYWNRDNVTIQGGLGLNYVFEDLNEVDESTIFVEDATRVTQGVTTADAKKSDANKQELMEILGGIYQTLGINENGTGPDGKTAVDSTNVNIVQNALTEVYESNPNKYKLLDNTDAGSFTSELKDMYKALVGEVDATPATTGILQREGYDTMPNNNYTSLAESFASNKTNVVIERDKTIAKVASEAEDLSGITNAELKYGLLYVAYPEADNDTYMSFMNMGSNTPDAVDQKGRWINGTIIQNLTGAAGSVDHRMIFTEPSFTESNNVRFQNMTADAKTGDFANLTAGRFMFLATPAIDKDDLDPKPITFSDTFGYSPDSNTVRDAFNLSFGGSKIQFHPWSNKTGDGDNSSTTAQGWYNYSEKYGFYNFTDFGGATYAIIMSGNHTNLQNTSTMAIGADNTTDVGGITTAITDAAAGKGVSTNRTIIFKKQANIKDKQFVGYYYEKLIDLLNLSKGAKTSDIATTTDNIKSDMAIQYND